MKEIEIIQILKTKGWNSSQQILVFAFCLLFLDLLLLFIRSRSWSGLSKFCQHHLYHLHLPLEGVSIEIGRVGHGGLAWKALFSLLGKLLVCSPAPAPPLWSVPTYVQ